jgi:WD40 repeat protein
MAWQMAMMHPGVLDKMKAILLEWKDNSMGKLESHSVWQRIFLSGILNVELDRPQYWVIDAMDECKAPGDMTAFLTWMQQHWPLSVLVTSRDAVEIHQHGANPSINIRSYAISEQDSLQDISLLLEANTQHFPCPASDKWLAPETLASQIIERSAGCFLWASLMCSELRQVTSEKEVAEVMDSTPSDMDAVYRDILARMETVRFGKEVTRAMLGWAAYAFRPLHLSEMQMAIEMDMDDKIDDIQRVISRRCGSLLYVDQHDKIQLVHLTAREFLTRGEVNSELVLTKSDAHRRLTVACLKSLLQVSQKAPGRSRKSVSATAPSTAPFTDYASKFLFQHLDHVNSDEEELLLLLSTFLGGNSLLHWIEYIAANGDLRTVYEAGKTIKGILKRRRTRSQPHGTGQGLALCQAKLGLLEKWGDDLGRLVLQFSDRLRNSPKSIHRHIAPFCPPDSAVRQVFAIPMRGLNVQGLSARGWDDCVTTIPYFQAAKASTAAAAPGYLAVGTNSARGQISVYDDAIFQEIHTIHHGERVKHLAFAESGRYLATVGRKTVRIWSPANGLELASFELPAWCACMAFSEDDTILRVATQQNQLVEWDLATNAFVHDEVISWEADLPERMRGRQLFKAWFSPRNNLLAAVYKGHDLVLWDCTEKSLYDVFEQNTGSVELFGSRLQARGWSTVSTAVFSRATGSNLFAVLYDDGDLVVFDVEAGSPIAVNTERVYDPPLASSHDGRTLAGVDKLGNLTLFEFKTLRLLYRARLDHTHTMPNCLAFTSDDLRVIEVRPTQCRVKEPPVLRTDSAMLEHHLSLIAPKPSDLDDIARGFETRNEEEITAMTCSHEFSVVFYATGNRSVYGYDISGPEPGRELLFVHESRADVVALHFDDQGKVLACGGRWNRYTARAISRRLKKPQERHAAWEVGAPLVDVQSLGPNPGILQQMLVSSRHGRLLVSTSSSDTVWPMPRQDDEGYIQQLKHSEDRTDTSTRWITCPCPSSSADLLLGIEETGQEIHVYDWVTFNRLRVVPFAANPYLSVHCFAPLSHPHYFATYAKSTISKSRASLDDQRAAILLWDYQDLEGPGPAAPRCELRRPMLPSDIVHLIGVFGTRMVFYTADHWIASYELMPPGSPTGAVVAEGSFVRHFFLPNHWVGSVDRGGMLFGVGSDGEIIFARRDELAVIKRGLEVTEDGGAFQPRQLSNETRAQFGARIPSREPGLLVAGWLEAQAET